MKPKHQRLLFVIVSMIFLVAGALLTLSAFRENLVFFYSPTELTEIAIAPDQNIRVGGLVKEGSIVQVEGDKINFIITDGNNDVNISYNGLLPNLS